MCVEWGLEGCVTCSVSWCQYYHLACLLQDNPTLKWNSMLSHQIKDHVIFKQHHWVLSWSTNSIPLLSRCGGVFTYLKYIREYRPGGDGQAGADALDDGGHEGHGVSRVATNAELWSIQGWEWDWYIFEVRLYTETGGSESLQYRCTYLLVFSITIYIDWQEIGLDNKDGMS